MDNFEYKHYSNFPKAKWTWENFTPREMRSKGDNKLMIDRSSMDKLQLLRVLVGKPFGITSAYRSPEHNNNVGSTTGSMHLKAKAYDVRMEGHDPEVFYHLAKQVGFTGFGFYSTDHGNFMHIDTGRARFWAKPKGFQFNIWDLSGELPKGKKPQVTVTAPRPIKPSLLQSLIAMVTAILKGMKR